LKHTCGNVSPIIEKIRKQLIDYAEQKRLKKLSKESAGQKYTAHSDHHVDLAVAGAIGYAVVFHHVVEHGFESAAMLNNSDTFDAIMSINVAGKWNQYFINFINDVADVDWDGHMEIVLGTYGQQLVIYKDTRHSHKNKEQKRAASAKQTPENKRKSLEVVNDSVNSSIVSDSLPNHEEMTGVNTSTTEQLTGPPMSSTPRRSQITQLLQEMSMNQSAISSTESSPAVTPVKPKSRRGSRSINPDEPLQRKYPDFNKCSLDNTVQMMVS